GVQRTVKFAKYLPDYGWCPVVWTLDRLPGLPLDPSLADDLPDDVIVYASPHRSWGSRIRGGMKGVTRRSALASRVAGAVAWRLDRWPGLSAFPDDCARWARQSVGTLLAAIQHHRIEAVYSTYSPASNHALALAVKRRTGLPWVADFRDLWTDDHGYRAASARRRAADRDLEQDILDTADAVIGVSPQQTRVLASHVPDRADKFVTITNGFDPQDFIQRPTTPTPRGGRFVLGFFGRFDRWVASDALFDGLRRCVAQAPAYRAGIEVRVVGHIARTAAAALASTGVAVEHLDYRPHADAVRDMMVSDALLLGVPDGPRGASVIPGKLFEYLASGRRILAVGPPDCEVSRILDETRGGMAVEFNADDIACAITRLYDAWHAGRPLSGAPRARIEPYTRPVLTNALARVLDDVAARTTAASTTKTCRRELCTP
ncbi:MAG: glycosyltransferase, partial [Phycisphaerae bacterium]